MAENEKAKKIVIAEKRIKYFGLMLVCLMFGLIGLAMVVDNDLGLVGYLAAWFCLVVFGVAGVTIFVWKIFTRPSSIVFTHEGVSIKLSNKNIYNIPWSGISKIGLQSVGVQASKADKVALQAIGMVGAQANKVAIDEVYLVLVFKDASKYQFSLKPADYALFKPAEKLQDHQGDLKGHFYVKLSVNLKEERRKKLADEFKQKLSITLEKFPYLLKIKDKDLHKKVVEEKSF